MSAGPARSVVAFGDEVGLPRLAALLPEGVLRGVVRGSIRPDAAEAAEAVAARAGVPLLVQPRPDDRSAPAFARALARLEPDLLLVDSYAMRLPSAVLAIAPLGGVNVHGALLPRHRGANPTQWALIDDDRETGVTVHRMTIEFDEGDVLAQAAVPIGFTDTWVDVNARIAEATEELLARTLPALLAGTLTGRGQDEARASYRPRREAADGRIDWDASVLDVYNLVRALVAPHPGAFHERDGERVVLDRALAITEVMAMKYGPEGGQTPPAALRVEGDDVLVGDARLTGIDWTARTARLEGPAEPATRFAREQLGLTVAPGSYAAGR